MPRPYTGPSRGSPVIGGQGAASRAAISIRHPRRHTATHHQRVVIHPRGAARGLRAARQRAARATGSGPRPRRARLRAWRCL